MIRDLAPLVGRRLTLGVVPDWHGAWPLAAHPDYCRLVQESGAELLLHGYCHRRQRGWGPVSWLAERSDELNGLHAEETKRLLERGHRVFTEVFGAPARGFLSPAWQPGHVRSVRAEIPGLKHVLGFLSLDSCTGHNVPLATCTWDCGRWAWLGHIGHGLGWLLQSEDRVPVVAIHPRDLTRGFWLQILRLTRKLLESGYEPTTVADLVEPSDAEVGV